MNGPLGMDLDKQPGKSLMYIKNNSSPRIEPCGTTHIILLLERTPLHSSIESYSMDMTGAVLIHYL